MTKEELQEILNRVFTNEISADDAMLLVWGEAFDEYTISVDSEPRRVFNNGLV